MAITAAPEDGAPPKKSRGPLLISLLALALAGGAGFYTVYAGLLPIGGGKQHAAADSAHVPAPIAFVPVAPIVISLGSSNGGKLLRLGAQLEVSKIHEAEVTHMMPRVLDVMNSYLRAVEVRDLENSAALVKIRAHLLYRVQLVTGEDRVSDLLITEFVLN